MPTGRPEIHLLRCISFELPIVFSGGTFTLYFCWNESTKAVSHWTMGRIQFAVFGRFEDQTGSCNVSESDIMAVRVANQI